MPAAQHLNRKQQQRREDDQQRRDREDRGADLLADARPHLARDGALLRPAEEEDGHDLVERRGYIPERLTRDAFLLFLRRASDLGGLLIDGELDDGGIVINADVDQLVGRDDALALLRR